LTSGKEKDKVKVKPKIPSLKKDQKPKASALRVILETVSLHILVSQKVTPRSREGT
jgi:hypothetical protein